VETPVADPFTDQTTCDMYASLLRQGLTTQRRFVHAKGCRERPAMGTRKRSILLCFAGAEAADIAEEGAGVELELVGYMDERGNE
jgi:hypothetical protein